MVLSKECASIRSRMRRLARLIERDYDRERIHYDHLLAYLSHNYVIRNAMYLSAKQLALTTLPLAAKLHLQRFHGAVRLESDIYEYSTITAAEAREIDLMSPTALEGIEYNQTITHDVYTILRERGFLGTFHPIVLHIEGHHRRAPAKFRTNNLRDTRSLPAPAAGVDMSNKYVMDMYARTSYAPLHEKYEFTATAANNYARNHNAPTEWLISNCHEGSGGYYEPFCWLSFDEYSRMSRDIQMWYAPASAPDEWWDTQKSMVAKLRRLVTKGCTIDELVTTVGSGQMGPDIDRLIFEYRGYHRYLMRDVVRILARRWLDRTGEPGSLTYHRIVADMYA